MHTSNQGQVDGLLSHFYRIHCEIGFPSWVMKWKYLRTQSMMTSSAKRRQRNKGLRVTRQRVIRTFCLNPEPSKQQISVQGFRVHAGKRRVPVEVASELAQHATDEALTDREIDVLKLVAAGCSNKLAADRLHISEETVKGHVRNILLKLKANDRTHSVTIALRRGFIEL